MGPRSGSVLVVLAAFLQLVAPAWDARAAEVPGALEREFAAPPDSAKPWVYWFWKNGNITRKGITADLEAMRRVGIGGVIHMEVALTTPRGPVRSGALLPGQRPRLRESVTTST